MTSDVHVAAVDPGRFASVLAQEQLAGLQRTIDEGRRIFAGRVMWTVNSTARGGGVAEMLASLVAYVRGAGIDARWKVIAGDPDFFALTKSLHNQLHGFPGTRALDADAHALYEQQLSESRDGLAKLVRPGDGVLLHDPQTAGMVTALKAAGAVVVWRCHVGMDNANEHAREAWAFLEPYAAQADGYVFSRRSFAWNDLDQARLKIIAPSIDPFSPKNCDMSDEVRDAILCASGISTGEPGAAPTFTRPDGSPGRVDRPVEAVEARPLTPADRVVAQVSRWDRLKDPAGVMEAFARRIAPAVPAARLVLAGPSTKAVVDDPQGQEVLTDMVERRAQLPAEIRDRVHLLSLPMEDLYENAAIVNALQRRGDVLVQKSLAEGFGLTVAEAMWKGRPVVAARVGGIQDQIVDGESGILVDPHDLEAFGDAVAGLLVDDSRAQALGAAGRERVRGEFLAPRSLEQYLELFGPLFPDQ